LSSTFMNENEVDSATLQKCKRETHMAFHRIFRVSPTKSTEDYFLIPFGELRAHAVSVRKRSPDLEDFLAATVNPKYSEPGDDPLKVYDL